jgi:hypothetical protein
MGVYINPPAETKEEFLHREGEHLSAQEFKAWDFTSNPTRLPVALVDNGPFTAAAVAFDAREIRDFSNPNDRRRHTFFSVPVEKLLDQEQSGIPKGYLEDYIRS